MRRAGMRGLDSPTAASVPRRRRQHGDADGDDDAVPDRLAPCAAAEHVAVPAPGETLQRVGEERLGIHRQRHRHEYRQHQECQHEPAPHQQHRHADLVGERRVGRQQHGQTSFMRSMPNMRANAAEQPERERQQDEAERGRHRPVQIDVDVVGDEVGDQLVGRSAHQRGRDEVAEAQDEGQQAAGHHARHHLRQIDAAERGERPRAERIGRPHLRRRDRAHDAVDRQQRERQLDMRHGDDQADAGVHQVDRMIGDVQAEQQLVQDAGPLQQHRPCRRAHQDRGPERQQHQQDQARRRRSRQVRQEPGERKAQHQRDQRDAGGDPEGAREDRADRSPDPARPHRCRLPPSSAGRRPRADSSW